ncbi:DUF4157 domain-containing protein [[Leptolyngbya] sp. PCC 7376]|uniref:eCIS core domain-containing protein n=1 Tax=[Leptolyngbya] sp. PCC 7376 TaxID=111781 RepID=UPI000307D6CC|nr:DUF4157 domain-containing protein [[Leptolyngbya] sp. PCC 7376]
MTRTRLTKPQSKQSSSAIAPAHSQNTPVFSQELQQATKPLNSNFSGLFRDLSLPLQAKLTIGEPNDKYEQEADRVADQVVKQIQSPDISKSEDDQIQRREEIDRGSPRVTPLKFSALQRKDGDSSAAIPSKLETSINQVRGSGETLPDDLRPQMENAFSSDFSNVRIHHNAHADDLNRSIQAKAFTTGQDIFFRQGEYQPNSHNGQTLLAHELTHVVQQSADKTVAMRALIQRSEEVKRVKKASEELGYAGDDRIVPESVSAARYPLAGSMLPGEKRIENFVQANDGDMLNGLLIKMSNYPYITESHYNAYCEELLKDSLIARGNNHFSENVMADSAPYASYAFYPKGESETIYSIHKTKGGKIFTICPKYPFDMKAMRRIMNLQGEAKKAKLVSRFGEHDFVHSGTHLRGAPVESNMHIHQGGFGIKVSGEMVVKVIKKLKKWNMITEEGYEGAMNVNWG